MTRSLINIAFATGWRYEDLRELTAREMATVEDVWEEIQNARRIARG